MNKAKRKAEIEKLYHEIEALDAKYQFSMDNVEIDERILDMISKKIEQLEVLQNLID